MRLPKILFASFLSLLFLQACAQNPVVKISSGYVRGMQDGEAMVFKGIPYARPPVGALRFKAPQPAANWKDTLLCEKFGNVSAQYAGGTQGLRGDENSLFLNVYTPSTNAAHKMPVVVWVHGGGMTGGTGSTQNGHAFADKDSIVAITINYRLGVFGFLYMGDVDPAYRTSGNNGLLDLIMALQWVKQNIGAFGGDPSRVTVMGESAGAKLVSTLLTTKQSQGLFHQLVLESGAVQCIRDSVTAKAIRQRLLDVLHLQKPAELLNLPTAQLIEAQNKVLNGAAGTNYFGPVQDGVVITGDPYKFVKEQDYHNLRFLIGTNKRESKLFMDLDKRLYHPDTIALKDWYAENYPMVWAAFQKQSKAVGTDSAAMNTLTQYMYQMHSYRLLNALADKNNTVWMYRFDYSKDTKGAVHADELPYVWYLPVKHSEAFNGALALQVHRDWVAFIKGQQPETTWPVYTKKNKTVMVFNSVSQPVKLKEIYDDFKYPSAGYILR